MYLLQGFPLVNVMILEPIALKIFNICINSTKCMLVSCSWYGVPQRGILGPPLILYSLWSRLCRRTDINIPRNKVTCWWILV